MTERFDLKEIQIISEEHRLIAALGEGIAYCSNRLDFSNTAISIYKEAGLEPMIQELVATNSPIGLECLLGLLTTPPDYQSNPPQLLEGIDRELLLAGGISVLLQNMGDDTDLEKIYPLAYFKLRDITSSASSLLRSEFDPNVPTVFFERDIFLMVKRYQYLLQLTRFMDPTTEQEFLARASIQLTHDAVLNNRSITLRSQVFTTLAVIDNMDPRSILTRRMEIGANVDTVRASEKSTLGDGQLSEERKLALDARLALISRDYAATSVAVEVFCQTPANEGLAKDLVADITQQIAGKKLDNIAVKQLLSAINTQISLPPVHTTDVSVKADTAAIILEYDQTSSLNLTRSESDPLVAALVEYLEDFRIGSNQPDELSRYLDILDLVAPEVTSRLKLYDLSTVDRLLQEYIEATKKHQIDDEYDDYDDLEETTSQTFFLDGQFSEYGNLREMGEEAADNDDTPSSEYYADHLAYLEAVAFQRKDLDILSLVLTTRISLGETITAKTVVSYYARLLSEGPLPGEIYEVHLNDLLTTDQNEEDFDRLALNVRVGIILRNYDQAFSGFERLVARAFTNGNRNNNSLAYLVPLLTDFSSAENIPHHLQLKIRRLVTDLLLSFDSLAQFELSPLAISNYQNGLLVVATKFIKPIKSSDPQFFPNLIRSLYTKRLLHPERDELLEAITADPLGQEAFSLN